MRKRNILVKRRLVWVWDYNFLTMARKKVAEKKDSLEISWGGKGESHAGICIIVEDSRQRTQQIPMPKTETCLMCLRHQGWGCWSRMNKWKRTWSWGQRNDWAKKHMERVYHQQVPYFTFPENFRANLRYYWHKVLPCLPPWKVCFLVYWFNIHIQYL